MSIRNVLHDQWVEFFRAFSSEHAGRLVSFGVDGRQPKHEGTDVEVRQFPLRKIGADFKEESITVVISLGLSSNRLLRHSIQSVSHIRVTQTDDGSESALEIESLNGQTTTLNVSVPV